MIRAGWAGDEACPLRVPVARVVVRRGSPAFPGYTFASRGTKSGDLSTPGTKQIPPERCGIR
ncbi:Uncharacterised protein [Trueperella bialowiezensis]|uniref:Uncharacterized protein n=1 Tax=Trueperella bialowiezensis TaxID=312285 RepID=A0A448PFE5_9ACTO|nr:Uncharacterised protein [Trueperella bialowiezensis]